MKIGYARVSTEDQNLDLQLTALQHEGCATIFREKVSAGSKVRPELRKALRRCKAGDTLIVWKLDRLGRSLFDLIALVEEMKRRNVGLKVLTGHGASINTTTADGRMIFGILATLAEFERELIRERTRAGMAAARQRGVRLGRPAKLAPDTVIVARAMLLEGRTRAEISAHFAVAPKTLRRALAAQAKC